MAKRGTALDSLGCETTKSRRNNKRTNTDRPVNRSSSKREKGECYLGVTKLEFIVIELNGAHNLFGGDLSIDEALRDGGGSKDSVSGKITQRG